MTPPPTARGKRRALLSVYDKRGVVDLGRELAGLGHTLLSTGGTAEALRAAGVPVVEIAHYTGHPEILEGRVKTLHPKVHGGILADLSKDQHRADLTRAGIEPISLVVVNLYPFRDVASRGDARLEDLIEMIDVGGPAMVRAAAKNHAHVAVLVDPGDYGPVLDEIRRHGAPEAATRAALAVKAFAHTAAYDAAIHEELRRRMLAAPAGGPGARAGKAAGSVAEGWPDRLTLDLRLLQELRYGENPHQRGALYAGTVPSPGSIAAARQIQGKDLSFNNLVDLDSAWRAAAEFGRPASVIVKHNNPCGVALGATLAEAFDKARRTDPTSAFGGIVAFNRQVDAEAATLVAGLFLECVVAPGYEPAARDLLAAKPNLRVLETGHPPRPPEGIDLRAIGGGYLLQDHDRAPIDMNAARAATRRRPTSGEIEALDFAWRVARHVKSNAIVIARGDRTIGIGAGQMSRVDSVRVALMKALEPVRGAALASDAFFPFADGVEEAGRAGIGAIAQPGGSLKDAEVIAAADALGMAMVLTGTRHFRH